MKKRKLESKMKIFCKCPKCNEIGFNESILLTDNGECKRFRIKCKNCKEIYLL